MIIGCWVDFSVNADDVFYVPAKEGLCVSSKIIIFVVA